MGVKVARLPPLGDSKTVRRRTHVPHRRGRTHPAHAGRRRGRERAGVHLCLQASQREHGGHTAATHQPGPATVSAERSPNAGNDANRPHPHRERSG